MEYEEFYKVQDFFIKNGIPLTYRKPKVLKQGMSDMAFQSYIQAKVRGNRKAKARRESIPMKKGSVPGRGAMNDMSDYISYPVPQKPPVPTQVNVGDEGQLDIMNNIFIFHIVF